MFGLISQLLSEIALEIVGAAAVSGGTWFVLRVAQLRAFDPIGQRRRALEGPWTGFFAQQIGGVSFQTALVLRLRSRGKVVRGEVSYTGELPIQGTAKRITGGFTAEGGFLYDRFLKLDYVQKDTTVIQFGSILLELDPTAQSLVGRGVGFGANTRSIVSVDIHLEKKAV